MSLSETKFFFELTPEKILDAVETLGFRCTGRCLQLNSMENRVYEVEIELDESTPPKRPSDRFRIIKFYRPGRWNEAQIRAEHEFLFDLKEYEIPVVAPIRDAKNESLFRVPEINIFFAVFPKQGGRSPDELDEKQLQQIGRLLARLHNVGQTKQAPARLKMTPENMAIQSLNHLKETGILPPETVPSYEHLVRNICDLSSPWFEEVAYQRIHGDCHLGNLLWGDEGPFWVDFDDMVQGPCVQDIWLIVPGRDEEGKRKLNCLLEGYEQMREFDDRSLRLIEPLRAMRMIYFSAWIAKRWEDPAFKRTFVEFGTPKYWREQLMHLSEQWEFISGERQ